MENKKNMKADEIRLLDDRTHVRLKRGMYIDNKDCIIYELVDNSIDEHKKGFGNYIEVSIDEKGTVSVKDNGRGLNVEPSPDIPECSQAELALSRLKAGSKFVQTEDKTAGTNGVGSSCINFLSKSFDVTIRQNGNVYHMKFNEGVITEKLNIVGKCDASDHGTTIVAEVDDEMWKDINDYDIGAISKRIKQSCYLNPELTIKLDITYGDHDIHETYNFPEGVKTYLEDLTANKDLIHDPWYLNTSVEMDDGRTCDIAASFVYTESYSDTIYAFVNDVPNTNLKSSNITGFKRGLATAIKDYYDNENTKSKAQILAEDTREGIVAIISLKVVNPVYIGQNKDYLNMPSIASLLYKEIKDFVEDQLDKKPNEAKIILSKVLDSCRTREAATRAKENARNKKTLSSGKVNGLTKCISKDPEETFIWLVEGDSAGGSAKKARNEQIDAILPVFGKIPNTYNMTLDKVYSSDKMVSVIKALGCGIGPDCDIEKLNYKHVVILTDGDVDGWHIQCLWITFFYKYMRPLIDNGYLYIALPPLFTIVKNPGTKKEEHVYAYTIEEKDEVVATLNCKYEVMRNKGLGEMDWPELQHSTMDINTRKLIQVKIDEDEDSALCLDICMNSKSIQARKEFILINNE